MAPKPRTGRGRKRGTTSPAIAASARRNGRKRKPAPPPPRSATKDVLDGARSIAERIIDETEELYRLPMGRRERARELRANARALAGLVPKARLREAELVVRGEAAAIADDAGDPAVEVVEGEEAKN